MTRRATSATVRWLEEAAKKARAAATLHAHTTYATHEKFNEASERHYWEERVIRRLLRRSRASYHEAA